MRERIRVDLPMGAYGADGIAFRRACEAAPPGADIEVSPALWLDTAQPRLIVPGTSEQPPFFWFLDHRIVTPGFTG